MPKYTAKFPSLQMLSECMYELGIIKPEIDYINYTITAELTESQVAHIKECGIEITEHPFDIILPD